MKTMGMQTLSLMKLKKKNIRKARAVFQLVALKQLRLQVQQTWRMQSLKCIRCLAGWHAPVGKSSNEGVGCDRTMCRCNFSKSVGLLAVLEHVLAGLGMAGIQNDPNSDIFNHRSTTGWLNNGWNQDLPRVPNGSHRSNFQKTCLFFLPKDKKCVIYGLPPARSPAPHCNMFFLT